MKIAPVLLLLAALAPALAAPPTDPIARVVPGRGDYVLQYWQDGWRGRSPDGRKIRLTRTGRYALALDTDRMEITHLGPIPAGARYEQAARSAAPDLRSAPPADLRMTLTVDGRSYRCVGAHAPALHSGPRIVEAGRWLQRADVTGLRFAAAEGRPLDVDARLETIAWPDHLGMVLEATPGQGAMTAGPGFGRVGGGWGFEGRNDRIEPLAAAEDPEQLTLEMWAYVPDLPDGTQQYPWLVCKGGNEWANGAWGIALVNGSPTGFLCIGGGRENGFSVACGPGPAMTREAWHHLALTYDGATLRLYLDGQERGATPVNRRRTPVADALAMGRRGDNGGDGYHFRGQLDEVRLYPRALAPNEIAARFAHPEAPAPAPLKEWGFDPSGPAQEHRPRTTWTTASLRLELRTRGQLHTASAALAAGETWSAGDRRSVGISIDPVTGGSAPATGVGVSGTDLSGKTALPVTVDPERGWHRVNLDGLVAHGEQNNAMDRARITLRNPGNRAQPVRLLFEKNGSSMRVAGVQQITGISPVLRDAAGNPTGLPVQLSKNWHAQPGRDLVYQGGWLHAASFLRLPPHSQVELELDLAYAHWGGVAAASHAQLCLIGWGTNQEWNQSAIGAWGESICYEPDQVQAECLICDVRPVMVASLFDGKPVRWTWTGNVGGGDLVRLFDPAGKRRFPGSMRTVVKRIGPCLSEVTYTGTTAGSALRHSVTVSLNRTDDLVRGIYRLRLDVDRPVPFSRFVLFQIGADTYSYTGERRMAIGNAAGLVREWDTRWGGNLYRTAPMAMVGPAPWVGLQGCTPRDDGGGWLALANRGIVVREWRARLGGQPASPWLAEHGISIGGTGTSTADIVTPPGLDRLLPGDYVEATFEHVIVPQRADDYYGPNANLRAALARDADTWRMVQREAVGNDLRPEVTVGKLLKRWPLMVQAAGNRARFSVRGGLGYVPITLRGLSGHVDPVLETREAGGAWRKVDQSKHGRDYWQADYRTDTGLWDITYTVPMDTPGDRPITREFRFRLGK